MILSDYFALTFLVFKCYFVTFINYDIYLYEHDNKYNLSQFNLHLRSCIQIISQSFEYTKLHIQRLYFRFNNL